MEIEFEYKKTDTYIDKDGEYNIEITKATASKDGNEQKLQLMCETEGGQQVTERLVFRETTRWKINQIFGAVGLLKNTSEGQKLKFTPSMLEGLKATVDVIIEEYDKTMADGKVVVGKTAKIKKWKPLVDDLSY